MSPTDQAFHPTGDNKQHWEGTATPGWACIVPHGSLNTFGPVIPPGTTSLLIEPAQNMSFCFSPEAVLINPGLKGYSIAAQTKLWISGIGLIRSLCMNFPATPGATVYLSFYSGDAGQPPIISSNFK